MIQQQVKLPLSVAVGVVSQGIRIRFGRSLVTISGVALGIAFLMSIMANQVLKTGVAAEDALRLDTQRRGNFLAAETGPLRGKSLHLHLAGDLSVQEARFARSLLRQDLAVWSWSGDYTLPEGVDPLPLSTESRRPLEGFEGEVDVVVAQGDEALVHDWPAWLRDRSTTVLALPELGETLRQSGDFVLVGLNQQLRAEEVERLKAAEATARFRNIWIVCISLLVTVIGISNAMLMSVTERFRDIGTMKCLGALSSFVRTLFLLESAFMGFVGGLAGCLVGVAFSYVAYGFTYGFGLISLALWNGLGTLLVSFLLAFLAGIFLSIVAAIYPAVVASRMVPAMALRSSV